MLSRVRDVSAPCPTFSEAFDPKRNAFAFLRMVFALLVIISHSYPLGGFGLDPIGRLTEGQHTPGEIGVALFFLLSGFLITRSSLRSQSIGRFLWHRFLRIFPGYWMCLLVTAFAFSPLFELIKQGDFSAESALAYVRGNWAMFHFNEWSMRGIMNLHPSSIGEALRDNPQPSGINGSLWSLPYECVCYLILALLGCLGVLRRGRFSLVILYGILWALYAFSGLDAEYFRECFPSPWVQPIVMLALYFSAGCVCYLYRESIPASRILFAASVLLLAVGLTFGSFALVAPIAMSYVCMCLGFWLPIHRFDAWGDFSYGTYIYAFPVQQGLALLGVHKNGLTAFLALTVLITLLLAALSYHCVEGPSLRWKNVNFFRKRNAARTEDAVLPESELEAFRPV